MQAPDLENEKKATAITMQMPDTRLKMKAAAKCERLIYIENDGRCEKCKRLIWK